MIRIMGKEIDSIDLSRFKLVESIAIMNCGLTEVPDVSKNKETLELLALPKNNITSLPNNIGELKKLIFLNINENKITKLPTELSQLDTSNGGMLTIIAADKALHNSIKELLPNVIIQEKYD